jgi:probable HAF family extracellular repeat protein
MKPRLIFAPLGLLAVLAMPAGSIARAQGPKPATYKVTDLGTLGGANSFAYSINNSGMVAGGANTPGQNDFVAQTAFLWYGGKPISLGTLGGSGCPDCSCQRLWQRGVAFRDLGCRSERGRFLLVQRQSPEPSQSSVFGSGLEKRAPHCPAHTTRRQQRGGLLRE